MPQVFHVLCCYNCDMFQVHQVKKSKKWQCKVCSEKQSLKKAFRIGSASDCRALVQELNMKMGEKKQNVFCDKLDEDKSFEERESESFSEITKTVYDDQFIKENNFYDENGYVKYNNDVNVKLFSQENDRCNASTKHISVKKGDSVVNAQTNYVVFVNSSNSNPDKRNIECLEEETFDEKLVNILNEPKRCCLENTESIPKPLPICSIKKNRGFQIIKNAASKLS